MERASIDEREAAALIKKIDKQRRYYYNYFTDKKWEDMTQYDICLDSGSIPEEQILDVLAALYESILQICDKESIIPVLIMRKIHSRTGGYI